MLSPYAGQQQYAKSMDVTISVGFVRGIVMKEMTKRRKDWNAMSEIDSIKVVVAAIVPSTGYQAENFLSSSPLENPKQVGDSVQYNAIFPLKGRESNGAPTRIKMPGLLQREKDGGDQANFKRQTVELLISLVLGNEALSLGKSSLMVTGEEVKTKQSDLPIDTKKSTVMKLQKKSTFPMKRTSSFSSKGSIGPTSFKYDRRRRKFHLERDAVLRVYMKASPTDAYPQNTNNTRGMGVSGRAGQQPMNTYHNGIPKIIVPTMGSFGGLPPQAPLGSTQSRNNIEHPHPMQEYREQSGHSMRSQSNPRQSQSRHSIQGNGSMYGGSNAQGSTPSPSYSGMPRTRSHSTPRQTTGSSYGGHGGNAYGGSSFNGAGNVMTGSRGRTPVRSGHGQSGHQQYGGSSYGAPRKPVMNQGSQYGGSSFHRSGSSRQHHSRSQSPHVFNRHY
jgi:hypothetical protein